MRARKKLNRPAGQAADEPADETGAEASHDRDSHTEADAAKNGSPGRVELQWPADSGMARKRTSYAAEKPSGEALGESGIAGRAVHSMNGGSQEQPDDQSYTPADGKVEQECTGEGAQEPHRQGGQRSGHCGR
jgi:hypothetical protein